MRGCNLDVNTIHGLSKLNIQPGTQPGSLKRLKGKGIHEGSTRKQGDHVIEILVQIPNLKDQTLKTIEKALSGDSLDGASQEGSRESTLNSLLDCVKKLKQKFLNSSYFAFA
mgnify:CR=1 FL=1